MNHLAILANTFGVPLDMHRVQGAVYSVLIIGLGNVMPKLPRNGPVGVRTSWTQTDPVMWERTRRVAGYLCTLAGLTSLTSLPASGKRVDRIPQLALLGAAAVSVAFSGIVSARGHNTPGALAQAGSRRVTIVAVSPRCRAHAATNCG